MTRPRRLFVRRKREEAPLQGHDPVVSSPNDQTDFFEAVVRATREAVWDWDLAGDLGWYNAHYQGILGASSDDDTIASWHERVHPDDSARVLNSLRAAPYASRDDWAEEYRLRRDDGSYAHVIDRGTLLRDEDGRPVRMVGTLRDVTALKDAERQLRQERDYAAAILNSLPGAFFHVDHHGQMLRWNKNFSAVTGYGDDELAAMSLEELFGDDDGRSIHTLIDRGLGRGFASTTLDLRSKDGSCTPYQLSGTRFVHQGVPGFVGVGFDLTERKKLEDALTEETVRFRAQLESSLDGIIVSDDRFRRIVQNKRMTEIWDFPAEVLEDDNLEHQLAYSASRTVDPAAYIELTRYLQDNPDEIGRDEVELLDGTIIERFSSPVHGPDGKFYGRLSIHRDVTEQRRAEQRTRHLASHDQLTGLANRNLLDERIDAALESVRHTSGRLAVLDVDLDRFKIINDGYGHPFGDLVLKAVAGRLQTLLEPRDTLSRYEGDEFIILLADVSGADEAHTVAKRIVEALSEPLIAGEREIHISASVGVSVYPEDGTTGEELIDNADVAMYHAKDAGRNTYQAFDRTIADEMQRRIDLETRLRTAAQTCQLSLAFQPKVDLPSGRIVACEALLRWNDADLGPVPPAQFIPIAEDSGLIVPIGDWVLRSSCAQAMAWQEAGLPPITIAVNISARQFLQQDVMAWVEQTLHDTGLPPELLELELTESLLAQDAAKAISTVEALRSLGVKLAIDDFGTGYANLGYLRRFPVSTLKIDQSFVSTMLAEPGDGAIVQAAISLGHNLQLRVVAEGVETEAQREYLRRYGCDEIQGYLISKPVPADEFEALLRVDAALR